MRIPGSAPGFLFFKIFCEYEGERRGFVKMKRKQFLALMLTIALAAGTNTTAVTSMAAQRAASLSALQGAAGQTAVLSAADEDGEDSGSSVLEEAIRETIGKVSSGAAKEETVYVFTDPYGNQRDIIVSNWLKNPEGKDRLEDYSDLQDIENVKGDETFDKNIGGAQNGISKGAEYFGEGFPFVSYGDVYRNYSLPYEVQGCVCAFRGSDRHGFRQ